MRIAILSDCVLPSPFAGGHGLGRIAYQVATALLARGHDVMFFAKPGSQFGGNIVMPIDADGYDGETALAREAIRQHRDWPFDIFLDNGHLHVLSRLFPELPIVNVFHDQYQAYARCPILLSEGQRAMMPSLFETARIIPNALNLTDFTPNSDPVDPPYVLFMGALSEIKQPILAVEACARLGVKLIIAGGEILGKMPWDNRGSVNYVGMVSGRQRDDLFRGARVFLQLGIAESFGLTTLEAGLFGVPVVAWPAGGSLDLIHYGVNGIFVPVTGGDGVQNVCDAIERAWDLDRVQCRTRAEGMNNPEQQTVAYEQALEDCAKGAWW